MGFLRFLGKKKDTIKEDLDVPTMPPQPADFSVGMGSEEGLPPLPDLKEDFSEQAGGTDFAGADFQEQETITAEPSVDEVHNFPEEDAPTIQPKPSFEESSLPIAGASKPLFVRVDSFKGGVLKSINSIKAELSDSNELLSKLTRSEEEEAHIFREVHDKMDDIQKRLKSIDKILFSG